MCPKTDEERERRSTVGRAEEVLSYPLPCLHYHFPLHFHLHCHCILDSPASLTLLPLFGSSMMPWLGFTLAGIYRPLPLLAPDWLTRCILRHWKRTDECYVTRSGTETTHINATMLCGCKVAQPLAYTDCNDFEEALFISKFLIILLWFFSDWFSFEKDPGRGHVSPAITRVQINRWGLLWGVVLTHILESKTLLNWFES